MSFRKHGLSQNAIRWKVVLTIWHSKCYVSFGGLLMCLDGPHKKLSPLRIDHVYMLLKK